MKRCSPARIETVPITDELIHQLAPHLAAGARRPSSVIAPEPMWSPASDPLYRDRTAGASW